MFLCLGIRVLSVCSVPTCTQHLDAEDTWRISVLCVAVYNSLPKCTMLFSSLVSILLEIFPSIGLVLSWHHSSHRFLHYVWYPVVEWKFWKGGWMHIPKIAEWGSSVNIIGSLQPLPLRCSHSLGHHHDSVFFSMVHFMCQLLISEWALISWRGFSVLLGQAEHTIIFKQPFFKHFVTIHNLRCWLWFVQMQIFLRPYKFAPECFTKN